MNNLPKTVKDAINDAISALVSSVFGRSGVVTAQNGDYDASQVTNTPSGNISAIEVQAAINELDSEKQPSNSNLDSVSSLSLAGNASKVVSVKLDETGFELTTGGGGGGATNLSYTASPTQGQVNSDTGTDAVLPAADSTNAGLLLPADFDKLTDVPADTVSELAGKQDLISSPTDQNIAITDAFGQTQDSGVAFSTDGTLGANSDALAATQKATRTAITIAKLTNNLASVQAISDSNFVATYSNGASGVGATLTAVSLGAFSVDGYTPSVGEDVCFNGQTLSYQNGVYTCTTLGTGIALAVFTRRTDFDEAAEMTPSRILTVIDGTVYANTIWATATTVTTVGTDPISVVGPLGVINGLLQAVNNLSDVADQTISRTNLLAAKSGANTDITSVLLNQTGLVVKGATANALTIKPNETLTAARILSIITGDADRTLTFTGNASISGINTGDQTVSSVIPQAAHGFTVGQVLTLSGSTWVKAKTDALATAYAVGMVSRVNSSSEFVLSIGYIPGLTGLTAGNRYYISSATAGALTTTAPTTSGTFKTLVFTADSTTSGFFYPSNPIANSVMATVTASSTISTANDFTFVNSATATNQTLPTAVGKSDKVITVKNIGVGTFTLLPTGIETINGAASFGPLAYQDSVDLKSDNVNWFVI